MARLFIWPTSSWRKSYKLLTDFCNRAIVRARMNSCERIGEELATDADCVLDMIFQRETWVGAEKMGAVELMDELLAYVLAGEDTTAATLAWMVKYLVLDLELQKKLHNEICAAFGSDNGQPLDFQVIDNSGSVPILEAVVAETQRCAGVGSQISREIIDDEVILGRHIPKGTQLIFPTLFMSKQESDWGPDAKVWRPSRWLRPDGSFNRAAGPSLPFGIGQRACFGQRLAVLQLKIFVATLSRSFKFNRVPAQLDSWDAVEVITRQPKSCFVSLERWS
ncbi:cytochrome P450 family protein [Ceratobasidium sp. AG-Ba]|nr:cytochrome P450 family protein [Ceratobasidium sp. AG-Ba]